MVAGITTAQFELLKRQAARMQRENPALSHSKALDLIARREGFDNWSLLARARSTDLGSIQPVLVVAKLYEVIMRGIVRSQERGVPPKWWDEKVPANHPKQHYQKFQWIRKNFEAIGPSESSAYAGLDVMRRAVEFMDATELTPSNAWSRIFRGPYRHRNPEGFDHTSVWRDAEKRYVITTEPYIGQDAVAEIQGWCEAYGWRIAVAPKGLGIWNPCCTDCSVDCGAHTQLIVLSPEKNGGDPERVVAALS